MLDQEFVERCIVTKCPRPATVFLTETMQKKQEGTEETECAVGNILRLRPDPGATDRWMSFTEAGACKTALFSAPFSLRSPVQKNRSGLKPRNHVGGEWIEVPPLLAAGQPGASTSTTLREDAGRFLPNGSQDDHRSRHLVNRSPQRRGHSQSSHSETEKWSHRPLGSPTMRLEKRIYQSDPRGPVVRVRVANGSSI